MMNAGKLLHERPELQPAAAWNAGLVRFFAERPVTNLDGLVNDEILPYAKSGDLANYVAERGIAYIVDYSAMLTAEFARRGGYASGVLGSCLIPEAQIDASDRKSQWAQSTLTLYRVDSGCLELHGQRRGPAS
jgi:hypothetical protein